MRSNAEQPVISGTESEPLPEIHLKTSSLPTLDADSEKILQTLASRKEAADKKRSRWAIRFLITFLSLFTIFFLVSRYYISPVTVVGHSMEPTYHAGQMLFAKARSAYGEENLRYGDVIVFSNDATKGRLFIKRLVGFPGDELVFQEGKLLRNGEEVEENCPLTEEIQYGALAMPYTVSENEYFALGDNRNDSYDCRFFGGVHLEDIRYVVTD